MTSPTNGSLATGSHATTRPALRAFHPQQRPRLRLLALPHAGGSATTFHPLSGRLAEEDIEVFAAHYPGRPGDRPLPTGFDIGSFADQVVAEFTAVDDGVPLAVLGHSMGATVGVDVIDRLVQRHRAPTVFVASGRRPPVIDGPSDVPALSTDRELIAEMMLLGGTEESLLGDADIMALLLPPLRADYAALRQHRRRDTGRLPCPIVALVGDADPRVTPAEARGWAEVTDDGFELRVLPGGHFYLQDDREAFTRALLDSVLTRCPDPLSGRVATARTNPPRSSHG